MEAISCDTIKDKNGFWLLTGDNEIDQIIYLSADMPQ